MKHRIEASPSENLIKWAGVVSNLHVTKQVILTKGGGVPCMKDVIGQGSPVSGIKCLMI